MLPINIMCMPAMYNNMWLIYYMITKQMKTLELHHPLIKFLKLVNKQ